MKKSLFIIFILYSSLAFSQKKSMQELIANEFGIMDYFTQLAPMSINPYASVFFTSALSKMGFHNSFVASNPFFNSWIIVIFFGILFLFTLIVRPVMASNQITGTMVKVDEYLETKAAIIINLITIGCFIFSTDASPLHNQQELVYTASAFPLSIKVFFIAVLSTYFIFVMMTVRLFIDFLVFLSPIPLLDSALQIIKIFITLFLVVISIVSPITSFGLSIGIFLIYLLFFNKVQRVFNKVKYLIISPILHFFKQNKSPITKNKCFSIPVYTSHSTPISKTGDIVQLIKTKDDFFIEKKRLLLPNKKIAFNLNHYQLNQNRLFTSLESSHNKSLGTFILNRTYHPYLEKISSISNLTMSKKISTAVNPQENSRFFNSIKKMFTLSDIKRLQTISK